MLISLRLFVTGDTSSEKSVHFKSVPICSNLFWDVGTSLAAIRNVRGCDFALVLQPYWMCGAWYFNFLLFLTTSVPACWFFICFTNIWHPINAARLPQGYCTAPAELVFRNNTSDSHCVECWLFISFTNVTDALAHEYWGFINLWLTKHTHVFVFLKFIYIYIYIYI